jgi:hypothetical protein
MGRPGLFKGEFGNDDCRVNTKLIIPEQFCSSGSDGYRPILVAFTPKIGLLCANG